MTGAVSGAAVNPIARVVRVILTVGLAAVLIVAGGLKLSDPGRFAVDIANFRLWPALAPKLAAVLPAMEIVTGAALLLLRGGWQRSAALAATLLFGLFAFAVAWAWLKGIDVACGCFGAAAETSPVTGRTLLRNALLFAAALGLTVWPSSAPRPQPPATRPDEALSRP